MLASFESLLGRLARKGTETAKRTSVAEAEKTPTSIRLKPQTKHFIDHQAEALGTSAQAVINMILDGVAETSMDSTAGALRTIRERFFFVFQAHKFDLPGIVSVMKPHGFRLSDLDNPSRLLDLIDQASIQHIAQTFFVQPEWVSGVSAWPVRTESIDTRWYKNVHSVAKRLMAYHQQGLKPHVMFLRRERANFVAARADNDKTDAHQEPVGVVVRLRRTTSDGLEFTVYETWEFERWSYWRCREQLKLLIAFCDQARDLVTSAGYELPEDKLDGLRTGRTLAAIALDRVGTVGWFPDDYASLREEVTQEAADWPAVKDAYIKGKYDDIIADARRNR
jgi:hypothetical protein